MKDSLIKLRKEWLSEYFDGYSLEAVIDWLVASEDQKPVVFVGAGFSLNAIDRSTGCTATTAKVPLWHHVGAELARDLRLRPNDFDVPTLCDLYCEALGRGRLEDRLRGLLKDDDLECGPAHFALGQYGCEAVITTNCLDTLLDKSRAGSGSRWNRRISDSDLARVYGPAPAADLIYFHGHRDHPDTWVMSRSEYEDVQQKKPIMFSRVRQLLAQHPLLVVGFSLADPNFHQSYRLLTREMSRKQPLALAIMTAPDARSTPDAVRAHWRSMGLRIADVSKPSPRANAGPRSPDLQREPDFPVAPPRGDSLDISQFFEWVFPRIETTWSPSHEEGRAYIEGATGIERLTRASSLFDAWSTPRTSDFYARQDEMFTLWLDTLTGAMTPEEQICAEASAGGNQRIPLRASSAMSGSPGPFQVDQVPPPKLKHLPEWASAELDDATVWQIDALVGGHRAEVSDHFAWALQLDLFDATRADLRPIEWQTVAAWLANLPANDTPARFGFGLVAKLAHAWATRVENHDAQARIEEVATKRKIPIEDVKHVPDPFACTGFEAMLNGDFAQAGQQYRAAADRAAGTDQPLEEWAYAKGLHEALFQERLMARQAPSSVEEEDPRGKRQEETRARTRVRELEENPTVRAWRDRAERRRRGALEQLVNQHELDTDHRHRGGEHFGDANHLHYAWRSFRDLEVLCAPPHLLKEYADPLVRAGRAKFDGALLPLLVRYGDASDAAALGHALDAQPSATASEQAERDSALLTGYLTLKKVATITDRLGLFDLLPEITPSIRVCDLAELASFVNETVDKFKFGLASAYSRRMNISLSYGSAFSAVNGLRSATEALESFNALQLQGMQQSYFFFRSLDLPWQAWAQQDPRSGMEWLRVLFALGPSQGKDETVCNLALSLLHEHPELVRHETEELELQRPMREFCARILASKEHDELRLGCLFIESGLEASPKWRALYDRWFGDLGRVSDRSLRWRVIAEVYKSGGALPDELSEVCSTVLENEPADDPFLRHVAERSVSMLALGVRHLDEKRQACRGALLGWIRRFPRLLPRVQSCLRRDLWGDAWGDVIDLIERTSLDLDARLGLFLLLIAHANRMREEDQPIARDDPRLAAALGRVAYLALDALSDERLLVANHAAFALGGLASCRAPDEPLIESALRRMADSSRVFVRGAAAYGSGLLPATAPSERVREVAKSLLEQMAADPNAVIAMRLRAGQADAAALQRKQA